MVSEKNDIKLNGIYEPQGQAVTVQVFIVKEGDQPPGKEYTPTLGGNGKWTTTIAKGDVKAGQVYIVEAKATYLGKSSTKKYKLNISN